ncbi:hypothetical protein [Methanobrevibacter sp. DSM 116169]|uniref:hypothetical protein n=1 Tax=Methanobrevibacter sp. DSM 116169 TaxID=3242727 RepID=UPI0038FC7516
MINNDEWEKIKPYINQMEIAYTLIIGMAQACNMASVEQLRERYEVKEILDNEGVE